MAAARKIISNSEHGVNKQRKRKSAGISVMNKENGVASARGVMQNISINESVA